MKVELKDYFKAVSERRVREASREKSTEGLTNRFAERGVEPDD